MFGTIVCNQKELTQEEHNRYQEIYCGVCKSLKRGGQLERICLNYDTAFLALFLNGLYEEPEERCFSRCVLDPKKKKQIIKNKYIEYAADMTVLLAYYKCRDDWEDEKKIAKKLYSNVLKKDVARIELAYPRQANCVKESLMELEKIEKDPESLADDAINCSGRMLAELFVYKEDFWSPSLRRFGYHLGRFVYLMDAVLDYEKDQKKNNFNPLFLSKQKPEDMKPVLMQIIGAAVHEFENLPILQDAGILRNILYSGVWQAYEKNIKKVEEK
ncbi:MAG: DUF5685 family protein [Lachnospiraceae bacterium]